MVDSLDEEFELDDDEDAYKEGHASLKSPAGDGRQCRAGSSTQEVAGGSVLQPHGNRQEEEVEDYSDGYDDEEDDDKGRDADKATSNPSPLVPGPVQDATNPCSEQDSPRDGDDEGDQYDNYEEEGDEGHLPQPAAVQPALPHTSTRGSTPLSLDDDTMDEDGSSSPVHHRRRSGSFVTRSSRRSVDHDEGTSASAQSPHRWNPEGHSSSDRGSTRRQSHDDALRSSEAGPNKGHTQSVASASHVMSSRPASQDDDSSNSSRMPIMGSPHTTPTIRHQGPTVSYSPGSLVTNDGIGDVTVAETSPGRWARPCPSGGPPAHRCPDVLLPSSPCDIGTSSSSFRRPLSAMCSRGPRSNELPLDPSGWDVRDVGTWLEVIGLGQYRKKFTHHCIDGQVLQHLTDDIIRVELGIGPLGHRHILLGSIAELASMSQGGSSSEGGNPRPRMSPSRPCSASRNSTSQKLRYRPQSAPSQYPRRPASPSARVTGDSGSLGPASGRITVYEQHARLTVDLDRAQQRYVHVKSSAHHAKHLEEEARREVEYIKGMMKKLESNFKLKRSPVSGVVDGGGDVPWSHVGSGTNEVNRFPERYGTVYDHPSLEESFRPQINPKSKSLVQQTGSDFLRRLDADRRSREASKKNLQGRYYPGQTGSMGMSDPSKVTQALAHISGYFQSKGWITLSQEQEEYMQEIDDTLERFWGELALEGPKKSTGDKHNGEGEGEDPALRSLLKKKGPNKVLAVAAHIKSKQFLERYKGDLRKREETLVEMERSWRSGHPNVQKEQDLRKCEEYFAKLGWRRTHHDDPHPAADELLTALLKRAQKYKEEYEKMKDKDKGHLPMQSDPVVPIKWDAYPWSSDGLNALNQQEMERQAKKQQEAPRNELLHTVSLLAGLRTEDLTKLEKLQGDARRIAVFRALRTQLFIEDAEKDLRDRKQRMDKIWEGLAPERKVISAKEHEEFFERLVEDAVKRNERMEKLIEEKQVKEAKYLSDHMVRPRSHSRPRSARR